VKSTIGSVRLRRGKQIKEGRAYDVKSKLVSLKYQSVAPDGPSMPPPIKKETWVAGKQEGGAGRQSAVPAARLGTVVG
jgi:hypothetical protein